jgi:hypothetical protein
MRLAAHDDDAEVDAAWTLIAETVLLLRSAHLPREE